MQQNRRWAGIEAVLAAAGAPRSPVSNEAAGSNSALFRVWRPHEKYYRGEVVGRSGRLSQCASMTMILKSSHY